MSQFPLFHVLAYAFAVWFGLYLPVRHFHQPGMRYSGLGLLTYAFGLSIDTLARFTPDAGTWGQWRFLIGFPPLICWFLAVRHLLPRPARAGLPSSPLKLLLIATIFFFLSVSALILPQEILSSDLVMMALMVDLFLVGYAIATLDAYEEGESLLPHLLHSFSITALLLLLVGGQIVLAMAIEGGPNFSLLLLLLSLIATTVAVQIFFERIQQFFDRWVFRASPRIRSERETLRAVSTALPRMDETVDIFRLEEAEFDRLTRRALSHLSDLSRLASSPLTRLPEIDVRLAERGRPDTTLERAAELKKLLSESIEKLKPSHENGFGTSDEWRYYNALYYPYVLGLKPYSRRSFRADEDIEHQSMMEWFRLQVPERTLHNWQNAAARLIARDLRENS